MPSVQPLGRGRTPSSPHHGLDGLPQYRPPHITDWTDYPSAVRPELGRDYRYPGRPDGVDGRPDRTMRNTGGNGDYSENLWSWDLDTGNDGGEEFEIES